MKFKDPKISQKEEILKSFFWGEKEKNNFKNFVLPCKSEKIWEYTDVPISNGTDTDTFDTKLLKHIP